MTDQTIRILVVDDRAANRRALIDTLECLDVEVVEVESGNDALKVILHTAFSVILLDVNMPGMDGFETAELIASHQLEYVVPTIFLTANDHPENTSKWHSSGAVDYIVKPFDPNSLIAKVRVFIQLYKQQQKVKKALSDAVALRERSELLIETAGQGLIVIDNDVNITFVNRMACTLLRSYKQNLMGSSIMPFVHDVSSSEWCNSPISRALSERENVTVDDTLFINEQGDTFPVEYTIAVIMVEGTASGAVLLFQDITERKQASDKMAHFAQYDQLTGVYNRRMFITMLEESICHAKRFKSEIALHFIDLDRFKEVNDTLGHDAGDRLLKDAVLRINGVVRDVDIVARLGGDEFGIIQRVDDSSGFSSASMAQRIIDVFGEGFDLGSQTMYVGCSIGIAQYPTHADSAGSLVKAADTAMYNVKESGRNGYRFFNDNLQLELDKQMLMITHLKSALKNAEFELYYQPQVDAPTNRILGVEALMRWNNPELGVVGPDIFIPLAEKTGLINSIGKWCLKVAALQAVEWNVDLDRKIPVSVNISVHQLMTEEFIVAVEEILSETKLPPALLILEITESALMQDPEYCIVQLNKLYALGVCTSVDDFGAGFSSLNYLGVMPASCLKIDKSFVSNIHRFGKNQKVVKSIIGLANSIDLNVMVEGVETKDEFEFFVAAGCEHFQGYYFSKPLTASGITDIINIGEVYPHSHIGDNSQKGKLCSTNDTNSIEGLDPIDGLNPIDELDLTCVQRQNSYGADGLRG